MKTNVSLSNSLLALAAALSFPILAAAEEIETHELDGISRVDFQISKANVTVTGSDRTDLELALESPMTGFDPDAVTKTVERKGDTLHIVIEYEKPAFDLWGSSNKGYKEATLHLPRNVEVSVRTQGGNISLSELDAAASLNTSGGNIQASNVHAKLNVKTSGGNIRLSHIEGDTEAKTSGGNIKVDNLAGRAAVHTSGGNIDIEGQISALDAHTSGGSINAELSSQLIEPLTLKTSGGNVSARLEKGLSAPAELRTAGGSVTIQLPRDQGFDLMASSSGGRVVVEHSGGVKGSVSNKNVEGSVNGGGPLVTLKTSAGRVLVSEI